MDTEPRAKKDASRKRSLSLRVQRTTVEYSYVQIPLTEDMLFFDPEGSGQVDVDRAFTRGLELAQELNIVWFPEFEEVEPHPYQKAPDPEEKAIIDHPTYELD